jgi:hypothetical protein
LEDAGGSQDDISPFDITRGMDTGIESGPMDVEEAKTNLLSTAGSEERVGVA